MAPQPLALFLLLISKNEAEGLRAMMGVWHPDEDVTPTPKDVELMAAVLEGRHGDHAAQVAEFFASLHSQRGDAGRCWAWSGVAERVRQREHHRLLEV
jgi:hypothetical protein